MRFGVFTPTNNIQWLAEAYESLRQQTYEDWKWIVLLNGEAADNGSFPWLGDPRVHVMSVPDDVKTVGALKRYAAMATGPECSVLVELDHDDILRADCLKQLFNVFFENPSVGFVYSDDVRFTESGRFPSPYSQEYGWEPGKSWDINGRTGVYQPSFDVTPQSLARIWYAPDHVRAWRRSTYEALGGHDPDLPGSDDYDLLCRTYLATTMYHIREPLYGYRVHNSASAEGGVMHGIIQQTQFEVGHKYRIQIAETWAHRRGLGLIDLCSGGNPAPGYVGLDKMVNHDNERFMNLDERWKYDDGLIGVIRAQDALEHLKSSRYTMHEIHRVLTHGGWLFSDTPSTDGRGAFQDPTHVSYWNSNSFWYWTSEAQRKYLPGYPNVPHFQMWHVENMYYSDWYKLHNIPYVRAHMSAIKEGCERLPGPYNFTP